MQFISTIDSIDKQLFLYLNSLHCPFLDFVMWHISQKLIWVPLYLVIIWQISIRRKWKAIATVLFLIVMIVISDQISSGLIKNNVERLRPSHNPEFTGVVHLVNNYGGGTYGFVSSHAANTFALAIFVSLFFRIRWVTISILAWAAIVSYSRIYLGVHYPLDILGGAMVGLASGIFIFYVERWFFEKYLNKKE